MRRRRARRPRATTWPARPSVCFRSLVGASRTSPRARTLCTSRRSRRPSTGSSASKDRTAVRLLCRQYLGMPPKHPNLLKGIDKLKRWPPGTQSNIYYDYYATQVMHHAGGEAWQFWNEGPNKKNDGIRDILMRSQDEG